MVTLALPNLTLNITPPGGTLTNYTFNLGYNGVQQGLTINQNFGRQGDTATFTLVDDYQGRVLPNFYIPVESQISLTDNTANQNIFAGVVVNPQLFNDGSNRNEWVLSCVDYTYYADNAWVHGTFNGQTIDNILVSLTRQANCGINAATVRNGGFVTPAPSLTRYSIGWTKLSSVWRNLAQLASSSTPYGWYVDQNRNLHFVDATTASSSGATFTTSPTIAGSLTEGHIGRGGSYNYEWDGNMIANRILVQGANQTITSPRNKGATNTWRSDGVQDSWGLKFTVTNTPFLTLNGVSTPVAVVKVGSTSTSTWQVTQNANGQYYLVTSKVPTVGTTIKLWYDYQVPITAQANDIQSQATYPGPNGGIFTKFISDSTLVTPTMAMARAQREKTEYAFAVERATFDVTEEFFGYVRSGQTFNYVNSFIPDARNSYNLGVSGPFLCISNTVTAGKGGYRNMTVTGVRI